MYFSRYEPQTWSRCTSKYYRCRVMLRSHISHGRKRCIFSGCSVFPISMGCFRYRLQINIDLHSGRQLLVEQCQLLSRREIIQNTRSKPSNNDNAVSSQNYQYKTKLASISNAFPVLSDTEHNGIMNKSTGLQTMLELAKQMISRKKRRICTVWSIQLLQYLRAGLYSCPVQGC